MGVRCVMTFERITTRSPPFGRQTAHRILLRFDDSRRHPSAPLPSSWRRCSRQGCEVGTTGRQEQQSGADCLHSFLLCSTLMGRKIIPDDGVFRRYCGSAYLAGISSEPFPGHRTIRHHRCCHAGQAQLVNEGRGFPVPMRNGYPSACRVVTVPASGPSSSRRRLRRRSDDNAQGMVGRLYSGNQDETDLGRYGKPEMTYTRGWED